MKEGSVLENMEWVDNKIFAMDNKLRKVNQYLEDVPTGTLKVSVKKGKPYYYQQIVDDDGTVKQIYLPHKNMDIIKQLAYKRYYKNLKAVMETNKKALMKFRKNYNPTGVEACYDTLPEPCKEFVTAIEETTKQTLAAWYAESFTQYEEYPEKLIYETDKGHMVRSKSELIIANLLFKYRDILDYKYERALSLEYKGSKYTIHPDFTIINLRTGKITYWEHAGIMDDPVYGTSFVWKNNLYHLNGIMQGKDVLYSYESQEHPLDVAVVKQMVEELISD